MIGRLSHRLFCSFRSRVLLMAICLAAAVGWFWWNCNRNAAINFLPIHRGAEWIIYPTPPKAGVYRITELSCDFRRTFKLNEKIRGGTLRLCAFKRAIVSINGQSVELGDTKTNWKRPNSI